MREDLAARVDDPDGAKAWLQAEVPIGEWGAQQAVAYVATQKAAIGLVPTQSAVVFERFFDEAGGMQLVVHAPFGTRVNRSWGLALRKRFCRTFNFELQASADDDGIVLSLGPQHSFPLEQMFAMVTSDNVKGLLEQAVLAVPMFNLRWRWNATRAFAVLRQHAGKRVPPPLQRMRSDDLLFAVFPEQTACLEHIVGDIEIPDHARLLHRGHGFRRLCTLLRRVQLDGRLPADSDSCADPPDDELKQPSTIRFVACDTREPSPFSHERLNANPYAFLDDAPLEERRARAVATRRSLTVESVGDLGRLDPEAIRRVREEAWPLVRNADELHDALWTLGAVPTPETERNAGAQGVDHPPVHPWAVWFRQLRADSRATTVDSRFWIASERFPMIRAALGGVSVDPTPALPASIRRDWPTAEARLELIRGWVECSGPTTASALAVSLSLDVPVVRTTLEALEGEGAVLRGHFTSELPRGDEVEWCDRRLLARIHRLTMDRLRRQIEPVPVETYLRFLARHQHLDPETRMDGVGGLHEIIAQLQGFEAPAGAWEEGLLASPDYSRFALLNDPLVS